MAVSILNCPSFQNTAKKHKTTTGKYHRFIPNVPQEFDCRVKASIKHDLLDKDIEIKNDQFKTFYEENYTRKVIVPEQLFRPPAYTAIHRLRNVQEKAQLNPPIPSGLPMSEMKTSFRMMYYKPTFEEKAPCGEAKCHVVKLGAEQQPAVPVNKKGFWKWTDPYVTVYKSDYVPTEDTNDKINVNDFALPPASGNKAVFDKTVFKHVLPTRLMSRAQKRVKNFGMQSEYQDHYIKQTFSYLYPYIEDKCTMFDDSLPEASRWQNLAPPGMYCSEYCNIGGSVRRVIDLEKKKKEIVRTENCCRI